MVFIVKKTILLRLICLVLSLVVCFGIASCADVSDNDLQGGTQDQDSDNNGGTNGGTTDGNGNNGGTTDGNGNNGGTTDGSGNNNGNTGGNGNNGGTATMTEEQMFAAFLEAYNATIAYNGALSVEISMKQDLNRNASEIFGQSLEDICKYTTDGTLDKVAFTLNTKEAMNNQTETDTFIEKTFSQNGLLYQVYRESNNGALEFEEYTQYVRRNFELSDYEVVDPLEILPAAVGGITLARSYSELTSSFSSAYSKIISDSLAMLNAAPNGNVLASIAGVPEISITKGENGEIVLRVVVVLDANIEGTVTKQKIDRIFTCKDGKITSAYVNLEIDYKTIVEGEEQSVIMDVAYDYKLSYSFDETYYNSIEVSLPSDPNQICVYGDFRINVFLGEASFNMWVGDTDTSADVLAWISEELCDRFGYFSENDDIINGPLYSPLVIKGLYYDKQLTRKIDPATVSVDELAVLENIYVDFEIASGYALVIKDEEENNEISLEYQIIVSTGLFMSGRAEYPHSLELAGATKKSEAVEVR